MGKLSRFEISTLKYLDDLVKNVGDKIGAMKELTTHMGLTQEEAINIYRVWYFNQKEDIDYSNIDLIENPLIKFVFKMSTLSPSSRAREKYFNEMYENHLEELEKIYGYWFSVDCGWATTKTPSLDWTANGVEINLDAETWEEGHFSGLDEDSIWIYHEIHSHHHEHYDEVSDDELNYMEIYFNDETFDHMESISLLGGKNDFPGKDRTTTHIRDGVVIDFLEKFLPKKFYEEFVDEFLYSLSAEVGRSRINEAKEVYKDEIKYKTSTNCACGRYCITIPYDDLLSLIKENNLVTLSDLKDIEIQDTVSLYNYFYDTWLDDDGKDSVTRDLNDILDKIIESIENDSSLDLAELIRNKEKWEKVFKELGFTPLWKVNSGSERYISQNKKIQFDTDDIDYIKNKIKILYNGKTHIIPLENLSDWTLGGVLDLNESIKYIKKLLNESVENITKISIFDFDGTLMRTPHPDKGKIEWENFYNKKYPHIGWWSKPESLDDAVFNIEPIESTISDYKKEIESPNTLVIMLTGRLPHQHDQIMELLKFHNIIFTEYHYKESGDTLNSKLNSIINLLNRFPQVNYIEMWEDREPHAIAFEEWGKENDVNIKVNLVK